MENQIATANIDLSNNKTLFLDSIWRLHSRVLDYDIHYSNVRVALITVLITMAGVSGYEVIQTNHPYLAFLPGIFLIFLVLLSNWLVNAGRICKKTAQDLEELAITILSSDTIEKSKVDSLKFTERFGVEIKKYNPPGKFFHIHYEIGNILFSFIAIIYFVIVFIYVLCPGP
ncbi:hypothetical protein [Methylovulum sp.]|uniref:hypothetical protein n=1 Tax=Methylovulum sp. TaxID=1916980 RepID=UPI002609EA40|nr:hypothetical protein [Methylovulum sp.]MDD5125828.1 hypothetical protein [Methylovulum sp.]